MRDTTATVYCLVRGEDHDAALARPPANMEWYGVWEAVDADRLAIEVGDLAEERLGLSEERFENYPLRRVLRTGRPLPPGPRSGTGGLTARRGRT